MRFVLTQAYPNYSQYLYLYLDYSLILLFIFIMLYTLVKYN